mgnify:CR=1 FL=1
MITVTERAVAELQGLLATNHAEPGQGIKLVPNGAESFGMSISTPGEHDEVIHEGGAPLLIVDSRLVEALDGAQIDCDPTVVDGQSRPQFMLRSPR